MSTSNDQYLLFGVLIITLLSLRFDQRSILNEVALNLATAIVWFLTPVDLTWGSAVSFFLLVCAFDQRSICNWAALALPALIAWFLSLKNSTWGSEVFFFLRVAAFSVSPLRRQLTRGLCDTIAAVFARIKPPKIPSEISDQNSLKRKGSEPSRILENPDPIGYLNDPSDATVDIVAVHGLGSSVETTWTHPETKKLWLKDFLPDDFPKARIMTFRHNSSWMANSLVKDLEDYGMQLLSALRDARTMEKARDRPLILIGHSFGGLLIEQALVLAKRPVTDKTVARKNERLTSSLAGTIFLGTPHAGSGYSTIGKLYCFFHYWDGANPTLLRYIDPDSPETRRLENEFASAYKDVPSIDYYEAYPNVIFGFRVNLIVTRERGTRVGSLREGLDTDHFGLNKFESKRDASYRTILNKIREMTESKIDEIHSATTKNEPSSQDVLTWLSTINQSASHSETVYRDRLNKLRLRIGQKSLESPEFKGWYNSEHRWLWCRGKAGAGKTSLATTIIHHLLDIQQKEQPNIGVVYFYCVHSDKEQSALGFLTTIVYQLASQAKQLPDRLFSLYKSCNSSSSSMSLIADNEYEEYVEIFNALLSSFNTVYLVTDAWDECRSDDAVEFKLHTKEQLWRTFLSFGYNINLLVTSRDDHPENPKVAFHTMDVVATDDTISLYISERIAADARLHKVESDLKTKIKDTIVAKAAGIFLPARLYIDHLASLVEYRGTKVLTKVLENLPSFNDKDLEENYRKVYQNMLQGIWDQKSLDVELAREVLSWLVFTKDPVGLKIEMVQYAVSAKLNADTNVDGLITEEKLLSVCRTLVEVDHQSRNIRFVHYTAGDYFSNPTVQAEQFPNSQSQLAKSCLDCAISDVSNDSGEEALYQYASRHWGHHAQYAEESVKEQIQKLLCDYARMQRSFQRVVDSLPTSWGRGEEPVDTNLKPLHLAAYFGLISTAKDLLDNQAAIEAKDSRGWTALQWAIIGVSDSLVSLLLEHKASLLSEDNTGNPILFWAFGSRVSCAIIEDIRVGSGALVSLGEVSTVKSRQSFATALAVPVAPKTSHGITKLLLESLPTEDIDFQRRSDGRTLLSIVAENWQWEAVDFLLNHGANVDLADNTGMTPFIRSLQCPRYTRVIKNLVIEGDAKFTLGDIASVDASAKISIDDSAYSEKAIEPNICRLVGEDLGAMDEMKRTGLSLAAENRFHMVMEAILKKNESLRTVDINAADSNGMTPLHWACTLPRFHRILVENLVCRDDATVRLGTRQLPLPSLSGKTEYKWSPVDRTVRLLLLYGADVTAKNNLHLTPFELASSDELDSYSRTLEKFQAAISDSEVRHETIDERKQLIDNIPFSSYDVQRRDYERLLLAMLDRRGQFELVNVSVQHDVRLVIYSESKIQNLRTEHASRVMINDKPRIESLSTIHQSHVIISAAAIIDCLSTRHESRASVHSTANIKHLMIADKSSITLKGQTTIPMVSARQAACLKFQADCKIELMVMEDDSRLDARGQAAICRWEGRGNSSMILQGGAKIEKLLTLDNSAVWVGDRAEVSEMLARGRSSIILHGQSRIGNVVARDMSLVLSKSCMEIRELIGRGDATIVILNVHAQQQNMHVLGRDSSRIVVLRVEGDGPREYQANFTTHDDSKLLVFHERGRETVPSMIESLKNFKGPGWSTSVFRLDEEQSSRADDQEASPIEDTDDMDLENLDWNWAENGPGTSESEARLVLRLNRRFSFIDVQRGST